MLYYHAGVEGAAKNTQVFSMHIDHPHPEQAILISTIKPDGKHSRVITFQADGDELAAILWGLANYSKS